jgi:hypothetical protein
MGTTGLIPPGWYQDPAGRHLYRWWDGSGWTDRVGDGAEEHRDAVGIDLHPTPAVAEPEWQGPAAPRRSRTGWIIGGAVAGGLVLLAIVVVVGVFVLRAATGPIIDEDFESGAGPFSTDSDQLVELAAVDGAYQVTIKDSSAPQEARTFFEPARESVSVTTTARFLDTPGLAAAGVSCYGSTYSGYLFLVTTDGTWVFVSKASADDPGDVLDQGSVDLPTGPVELTLECRGGGTSPTRLVGRVGRDGGQEFSTTDPDGFDQFRVAGFFVGADTDGTVVAFDDFVVKPLG